MFLRTYKCATMPVATVRQSKIVAFGAQKTRTYTLKSRRTQNESLFGADFGPEA